MEADNCKYLRKLVTGLLGEDLHYLEVGVQDGASAIAVLSSPKIVFGVLIDNWGFESGGTNRGSPAVAQDNLAGLCEKALFITGDSQKVLPTLDHQFDLIFIDGDHRTEGASVDLEEAMRLLKYPTGVLVVDDVNHPQYELAALVANLIRRHKLTIDRVAVHFGMAVLKYEV